jgi:LuxR family maltose regulon positive regulatory protein
MQLVIAGCSNKMIAENMFIAENTVKFYVTSIYDKLGARNRAQAVALYLAMGSTNEE